MSQLDGRRMYCEKRRDGNWRDGEVAVELEIVQYPSFWVLSWAALPLLVCISENCTALTLLGEGFQKIYSVQSIAYPLNSSLLEGSGQWP